MPEVNSRVFVADRDDIVAHGGDTFSQKIQPLLMTLILKNGLGLIACYSAEKEGALFHLLYWFRGHLLSFGRVKPELGHISDWPGPPHRKKQSVQLVYLFSGRVMCAAKTEKQTQARITNCAFISMSAGDKVENMDDMQVTQEQFP